MVFSWRQKTSSFEYRISKVQNHDRACPQDNENNEMSLRLSSALPICETPSSATCTVPQAGGSFPTPPSHPCSSGKGAGITWHPRLSPRECSGLPRFHIQLLTEQQICTTRPKSSTVPPWTRSSSVPLPGHSHETNHRGTQPSMKPGSRQDQDTEQDWPGTLLEAVGASESPVLPTHRGEATVTRDSTNKRPATNGPSETTEQG